MKAIMNSKTIIIFILFAYVSSKTLGLACPENEEPTDCVNPCLPTCTQPFHVTCQFLVCNKGCQCKEGFIRSQPNGACVAPSECGAYCSKNQKYNSCGTECPDSCNVRNQACTDNCVMGCYCKKGYILESIFGECIKERECPEQS